MTKIYSDKDAKLNLFKGKKIADDRGLPLKQVYNAAMNAAQSVKK